MPTLRGYRDDFGAFHFQNLLVFPKKEAVPVWGRFFYSATRTLFYTMNGKFSNVPSVTRTFTSININTASGDFFTAPGRKFVDSK